MDLAYRSGEISIIDANEVCENDEFEFELGIEPKLKHVPALTGRGKPIAYYAMFKTVKGGYGFKVMSVQDIRDFASKKSQAYKSGYTSPWTTDFDAMAKKTVLKQALKYAPLKTDFTKALTSDESIKTEIAKDMTEVPNEYDDIETTIVDEETGTKVDKETGEIK